MKKILILFAVLFMTVGAKAQSPSKIWDFTKQLSPADEEDFKYDKEYLHEDGPTEVATWYRVALMSTNTGEYRSYRYGIGKDISEKVKNDFGDWVQLYANYHVLDHFKGLYFSRFNGTIGTKSIRFEPGTRMNINVSKMGIKIPGLHAGDRVRVLFSTASKEPGVRFMSITNGTSTEADNTRISSEDYKTPTLGEITVTNDGDLILLNSKSIYIYKISVNQPLQ